MPGKYKVEVSVGVFVLICLLCVGYLTIKLGKMELFSADTYALKARFSTVTGLRTGNDVQISGVNVGRVSGISLDMEHNAAIVTMNIRRDITLSDDSIAAIKTSGLIGDKYISLSPGGSGFELQPGDTIIDTQAPVDIEELVSKYVFGNVEE